MRRITFVLQFIFALLFGAVQVFAQSNGKVAGKVTDRKSGESLPGVTVIVLGTSTGAVTDVEGRYNISVKPGTYTLQLKFMSYATKEISEVVVKSGGVTNQDVTMDEPKSENLHEVVIRGSARTETLNSLLTFQKNTNTVAQVVSAESIRKSPDRNTSDVLKRVPGASMIDGKYIVVRGLSDRYNQTMMNGALMSSTEPDRKTFSFDLFPASIIDNIIINKAATPEMPAEFAGGLIQINTKDVPDQNFFNVSVGSGFNTNVLGKDFYTYKGGKFDFFGVDDGDRKLNGDFPTTKTLAQSSADDRAEMGRSLSDRWAVNDESGKLNLNLQATGGFVAKKDASKGWAGVFSFTYNKQNRAGSIIRNNYLPSDMSQTFSYRDEFYRQNVLIGGLANFTYRNKDTKISLKNSYTINSNDQTTLRTGTDMEGGVNYGIKSQELAFTSNRLLNSQLLGEHFLKASGIKIKWNGSLAWMSQDIPDMRRLKYTSLDGNNYYVNVPKFTGNPRNAGRFFSDLNETVLGASADASKTFKLWGNQQQVKVGGLFQRKDRVFNSRALAIIGGTNSDALLTLPASEIFNKNNYAADKFYLDDLTEPSDSYEAYANLGAGYLQFDNQFGDKIRLVWGARVEYFLQHLQARDGSGAPSENTATDVLPSLNLTYMLNAKTNIRLSGSQTVARPEFREIAPFAFYDFERNGTVFGNSKLERTKITNLDLRYEIYPAAGELLTAGVFYKYFKSPIEMMFETGQGSPTFSYDNVESATSYGVEIEFRKKLGFLGSEFLDKFALFGNAAWIKSEVKFPKNYVGGMDRPMYGQSPYLVNGGLQFDNENSGTNASVLFNVIGQRIGQVGNANTPNIWENPRPVLDFQITQRIFKNADIKFTASDVLNKKATNYWGQDEKRYKDGTDKVISQFSYGTNIGLTFNYKF